MRGRRRMVALALVLAVPGAGDGSVVRRPAAVGKIAEAKGLTLRLGEDVREVEPIATDLGPRVRICLKSGKEIVTERALYSVGRTGATDRLNLCAAGVTPDDRGRLIPGGGRGDLPGFDGGLERVVVELGENVERRDRRRQTAHR